MSRVARTAERRKTERQAFRLRAPRPGDFGIVISRQARLYADEFGWDGTFEGMLAEIVGDFINDFDPRRERCWIADREGEIVGSVFVVEKSKHVAQLRMLYVDAPARGLGIGGALVAACIRFARAKGYKRMVLWTNDILVSARRIYQAAGFRLIGEERHRSFGKSLVGQTWRLDLA
jgi:GNAT superfamily N-acetyltransferase